ncbi:MAG: PilZ domain-containing protein [Desulfobacterales bacterium]
MSQAGFADNRDFTRFSAQEGAFAVITAPRKLGQILDISKGGLSFTYIGEEKGPKKDTELDIFLSGSGFNSKNISYKTISDFEIESKVEFSSVKMRRCGVKFRQLHLDQISQIEDFLQKHTVVED